MKLKPMTVVSAVILIASIEFSPHSSAGVDVDVVNRYSLQPNTTGNVPVDVVLGTIEGCVNISGLGFQVQLGDNDVGEGSGEYSFNITSSVNTSPQGLTVNQVFNPWPSIAPCPDIMQWTEQMHFDGNGSLYVAHAGTDGPYKRFSKVSGSITDSITIASNTAGQMYWPLHVTGSVFAAESFGSSEETKGKAKLSVSGTIAGATISGASIEVESQTVIPEQLSIDQHLQIPITIPEGVTTLTTSIDFNAEIEVQAKGGGLFGTVTGSATAGVDFPGSISIGRPTGAANGPIAPNVVVFGEGNLLYAVTALPGDANVNGQVNFQDLLVIAQNYGEQNGNTWLTGDFIGDTNVSFTDLILVAQHYGQTQLNDGTLLWDFELHNRFEADWAYARSIVPEPALGAIIAGFGLVARRRR